MVSNNRKLLLAEPKSSFKDKWLLQNYKTEVIQPYNPIAAMCETIKHLAAQQKLKQMGQNMIRMCSHQFPTLMNSLLRFSVATVWTNVFCKI